jgi:hypothetical protein
LVLNLCGDLGLWPSLGEWIAPIAAFGFVGAFIDFYIGKTGQEAVKKRLEDWWIKSSYFRWREFGKEEALFAAGLIYRIFGTTFSIRRIQILGLIFLVVSAISVYIPLIYAPNEIWLGLRLQSIRQDNTNIALVLVVFSLSITLTAIAARRMAKYVRNQPYLNLIGLLILVLFQYFMFCYSQAIYLLLNTTIPILYLYAESPKFADYSTLRELITLSLGDIWNWFSVEQLYPSVGLARIKIAMNFSILDAAKTNGFVFELLMSVIVNVGRLIILCIFLFSYLLRPVRVPVMTIWARIIESEKPTFTLVFGGAAALLKAVQEVLKLFS